MIKGAVQRSKVYSVLKILVFQSRRTLNFAITTLAQRTKQIMLGFITKRLLQGQRCNIAIIQ